MEEDQSNYEKNNVQRIVVTYPHPVSSIQSIAVGERSDTKCVLYVTGKIIKEQNMLVQARNPITDRWVKIDRFTASIVAHKKSPGPYKGVQIVGKPIKISFLSSKKIRKRKGQKRVPPKLSFLARK